jgi:sporulation protein YlmC with PRC-barrel domain
MKFSELRGRAVVNLDDARKVGELDDLLWEPAGWRTVGVKVRTGLFSQPVIVPVEQVKSVGTDAITFSVQTTQAQAGGMAPAPAQSMEQAAPEAPAASAAEARAPAQLTDLLGSKVLTDTGTLLGEVQDVLVDPATLAVTGFVVGTGGLFARSREIPLTIDVRYGDKLITVPAPLSESTDGDRT